MGKEKLESRQEKTKEKFQEKAKVKKEKAIAEATGQEPKKEVKKKPSKSKVVIKKPVVDEAKSHVEYAPISSKTSFEVARAIRGKTIEKANRILDDTISMKRPIRYFRFNKEIPHRKGKGFAAGRYPIKVAKVFKDLIVNGVANAQYLNLDPEKLYIKAVVANRAISKEKQGKYTHITLTVAEKKEIKKSTKTVKK